MSDQEEIGKYIGKYRATVVENIDPEQRGRLQLTIPDVLGMIPSTWAEACVPLAGPTGPAAMGIYMVPPIGAGVWVEFEQGDLNYPIWVGCRWGKSNEIPALAKMGAQASPNIVIQTLGQNCLAVSDSPPTSTAGGLTFKSATGATLVVNDSGIYLNNGKGASITLLASTVNINDGALTVT